ncbi:MAG: ferritin family protein [Myxococcota bacterium]
MSTLLDLSKLSLMDALDLAKLIEMEAYNRYLIFAEQFGGDDAGSFFTSMADNEKRHGKELEARRKELFGDEPAAVRLGDLFDVEAPEIGAVRRGMSVVQAFEVALEAEKKAYDFYDQALPGVTDPEVRALFTELRDEESEHVEMLEAQMAKLPPSASNVGEYDMDESPSL